MKKSANNFGLFCSHNHTEYLGQNVFSQTTENGIKGRSLQSLNIRTGQDPKDSKFAIIAPGINCSDLKFASVILILGFEILHL
jgi:hypothetical protein